MATTSRYALEYQPGGATNERLHCRHLSAFAHL